MKKEIKLKTKLDFQFNTEDMEVPELDFLAEEPREKVEEIKILKKNKKKRYGSGRDNPRLF